MLHEYLEKLCNELAIAPPKLNEKKVFLFPFGKESVIIRDLHPGVAFHASICESPKKRKEELYTYLMRANLLGQGTGGSRIGLDPDEKFLTLSLGLPYELDYRMFRETIEEFINYLIYWRDEIAKFENEELLH